MRLQLLKKMSLTSAMKVPYRHLQCFLENTGFKPPCSRVPSRAASTSRRCDCMHFAQCRLSNAKCCVCCKTQTMSTRTAVSKVGPTISLHSAGAGEYSISTRDAAVAPFNTRDASVAPCPCRTDSKERFAGPRLSTSSSRTRRAKTKVCCTCTDVYDVASAGTVTSRHKSMSKICDCMRVSSDSSTRVEDGSGRSRGKFTMILDRATRDYLEHRIELIRRRLRSGKCSTRKPSLIVCCKRMNAASRKSVCIAGSRNSLVADFTGSRDEPVRERLRAGMCFGSKSSLIVSCKASKKSTDFTENREGVEQKLKKEQKTSKASARLEWLVICVQMQN